jgi:hypothetical protein
MERAPIYRPLYEGVPSTPGTAKQPQSHHEQAQSCEQTPPPPLPSMTNEWDHIKASRRLGPIALTTIVLGLLVELGVLSFLVYFWTGIGNNPDGEHANYVWRHLVLNDYAARTITICALILRTAVDLQGAVGTGLAAALLIEARVVRFSDVAAFSVIRAINAGPWSVSRRLAWSPTTFIRSFPAFASLILLLTVVAIQFSSTLLLSDFRPFNIISDPQIVRAPVLQTFPELLIPIYQQLSPNPVDSRVWQQAFTSFPVFAEQILSPGTQEADTSDTGLVKRALIPLDVQQRRTVRQFDGAAATYSSRATCGRAEIQGVVTGLRNNGPKGFTPLLSSARVEGTLSWETHPALGGIFDCGSSTDCPTMKISCALPYVGTDNSFASILEQTPTTMCSFAAPEDWTKTTTELQSFLLLSSTTPGQNWIDASNGTNGTLSLPASEGANEWAVYKLEGGITLKATLCQTSALLEVENISARTLADPGEATMNYDPGNKTWSTAPIVKMASVRPGATNADRGILTLIQNQTLNNEQLEGESNPMHATVSIPLTRYAAMYQAAGTNYRPDEATGSDIAFQFFNALRRLVYNPVSVKFERSNETEMAGNSSVYMCSRCPTLNGRYFDAHPYLVLLFHAALNDTGSAAQALHSTLFWLTQGLYYQALPGFDFGADSMVMLSHSVSIPRVYSGLAAVVVLTLLNLACITILVTLFLQRTKHSLYGNTWHAVAQLISPETKHLLDRSTRVTDLDVAASMRQIGLADVPAGVGTLESGRVAVVRQGAMLQYRGYGQEKQEQGMDWPER